ncbi:MAG: hypothetical protein MK171_00545 [Pirellulales bacterium]|nr:hypothetical protein [Pirellulales bacterium]
MKPRRLGTDEAWPSDSGSGGWVFPALLALIVVLVGVVSQRPWRTDPVATAPGATGPVADGPSGREAGRTDGWIPSVVPQGETVSLEIDFGNGVQKRFAALPWRPEMTVAGLLGEARQFRPGLQFSQQGEGAGGFLTGIDGLSNQGVAGKNWKFEVDSEHGRASFCVQAVAPGAHVLWKFALNGYTEPEALTEP